MVKIPRKPIAGTSRTGGWQSFWKSEKGDGGHIRLPKGEWQPCWNPKKKRVWQPFWSTVFKSRNREQQSVAILKSREKGKNSERGREAILESQKGKWQPYQNSEKGSYSHFVLRRKKGMSAVFVEILKRAIAAILESWKMNGSHIEIPKRGMTTF